MTLTPIQLSEALRALARDESYAGTPLGRAKDLLLEAADRLDKYEQKELKPSEAIGKIMWARQDPKAFFLHGCGPDPTLFDVIAYLDAEWLARKQAEK